MSTTTLGRRRGRMMARPAAPSTRTMRAVLAVAIVAGALAAVAYGVTREQLPFVAGGAIGIAIVAIGTRAPVGLLLIYAALMPWENAGPSGGAGTVVKLVGLAFGAAYVIHRGTNLRLDTVGPWLWGFVAWACASLLWTAQPAAVADEAFTLVQLFIVTILVADLMSDRPEYAAPVMWTYVFSATITSFIGLYMYAINNSSLPDGRAEAFIGQSAPQFATILLPAAIMLTWRSLHRPALWAMGGAIVVNLAIVLSATRSAWFGIVVAILLGILPRLETGRRLALIVAAAVVALAMLLAPGVGDLLTERLNTAIESGGTGRTAIWAVGLNVVPEHPIIGIGYGDFPSVINPENVRATILPVQTDVLDFPIGPHNIVVGTLVELGIVGLILLFGVARSLFLGRARTEAAVLARAVMIGFVVQSLFLGIANLKQVWLFAAITLGLAAAERLSQASDEAAPDAVAVAGIGAGAPASGRGAGGSAPAFAAAAAGPAGDAAIPLGPPAKPRAKASTAKAGTSASKPKPAASKPKVAASKGRAKAAPPPDEPDPTLGPEEADPLASITDDTTVATRRGQSVIQLPGEMPAPRRRTNEVIELPAPTTPPPPEGEDR
jgi:O-antigen ligase